MVDYFAGSSGGIAAYDTVSAGTAAVERPTPPYSLNTAHCTVCIAGTSPYVEDLVPDETVLSPKGQTSNAFLEAGRARQRLYHAMTWGNWARLPKRVGIELVYTCLM